MYSGEGGERAAARVCSGSTTYIHSHSSSSSRSTSCDHICLLFFSPFPRRRCVEASRRTRTDDQSPFHKLQDGDMHTASHCKIIIFIVRHLFCETIFVYLSRYRSSIDCSSMSRNQNTTKTMAHLFIGIVCVVYTVCSVFRLAAPFVKL